MTSVEEAVPLDEQGGPPAPTEQAPAEQAPAEARAPELPEGVLAVRVGPGANCSSAGSAIDILFYGSVVVGALAVALAAAFPPREPRPDEEPPDAPAKESSAQK